MFHDHRRGRGDDSQRKEPSDGVNELGIRRDQLFVSKEEVAAALSVLCDKYGKSAPPLMQVLFEDSKGRPFLLTRLCGQTHFSVKGLVYTDRPDVAIVYSASTDGGNDRWRVIDDLAYQILADELKNFEPSWVKRNLADHPLLAAIRAKDARSQERHARYDSLEAERAPSLVSSLLLPSDRVDLDALFERLGAGKFSLIEPSDTSLPWPLVQLAIASPLIASALLRLSQDASSFEALQSEWQEAGLTCPLFGWDEPGFIDTTDGAYIVNGIVDDDQNTEVSLESWIIKACNAGQDTPVKRVLSSIVDEALEVLSESVLRKSPVDLKNLSGTTYGLPANVIEALTALRDGACEIIVRENPIGDCATLPELFMLCLTNLNYGFCFFNKRAGL